MPSLQEKYDDAMFDFSRGDYDTAVTKLRGVLSEDPAHFDAVMALSMAYYRQGDYAAAIAEGRKAEQLRPNEQLVHTNLSLFYMKAGDKNRAEHHGAQARIASWKADRAAAKTGPAGAPGGQDPASGASNPTPPGAPVVFPEMPWKKKS